MDFPETPTERAVYTAAMAAAQAPGHVIGLLAVLATAWAIEPIVPREWLELALVPLVIACIAVPPICADYLSAWWARRCLREHRRHSRTS